MSKAEISHDTETLKRIFLQDPDSDEPVRIVGLRGAEEGLDHLEITTQTYSQFGESLRTVHRIYTTEE